MKKEWIEESIKFWTKKYKQAISAEEAEKIENNLLGLIVYLLKGVNYE